MKEKVIAKAMLGLPLSKAEEAKFLLLWGTDEQVKFYLERKN
jgi:hypothetical protein